MEERFKPKKTIKENTTVTVDTLTGEIIELKEYKTNIVSTEPDYIKLYINDIIKLKDLPKSSSSIMFALLKYMSYDNDIIIIGSIKRKIAKELDLSMETINKAVQRLTNTGVLHRKDIGLYIVNPYLFGRGKWQDIRELRMTVTYNSNGKFITSEVDKQIEMIFKD